MAKEKKKCDSENDLLFAVASSAVYVRTYVPVAYVCVRTVGSTCVRSKTVANTTYLVLTPSVHHAWGLAEVARLGLTLFTKFSPTRAGLRRKPPETAPPPRSCVVLRWSEEIVVAASKHGASVIVCEGLCGDV